MNRSTQSLASPRIAGAQVDEHADDRLVEQALRQPQAFGALYDRYLPRVYRYLFTRVNNTADTEDLTSQVFLAALENLRKFHARESFAAWLFGIAHHKAMDAYRKQVRLAPLEDAEEIASGAASPLAQVIALETRSRLGACLRRLKEEERELLRLRFAAQLSFAEIAAILGKRETAVKMALYRLLERLEIQMEEDGDGK